ncbi:MAG: molybdopterin-dependent oxidoreductase [Hyphomicrobiales bacterium]|nr:molybdopterin-dependent oxidoreductase [Hyphomicrobiales bacterium]
MDKTVIQHPVAFKLNGADVTTHAWSGERLSETLRERLGQRDVKIGCSAGDCGACTVLVDGAPVCACLTATQQAQGLSVETLIGLVNNDRTAIRLTNTFQNKGAAQCGICTPGMIVTSVALLRENHAPTTKQVEEALGGVLCRCTGYRKIIDAVLEAAQDQDLIHEKYTGEVGSSIRRLDGLAKVNGCEKFSDDIAPPGTLTVRAVRSPFAHAAFSFGDLDAFVARTPGIEAVLTAADVPGKNCFGVIPNFADQPVFAETESRFRGEAVAAIVGDPDLMRTFDMASLPMEWTELPSVQTVSKAMATDAPLLHDGRAGNVMCGGFVKCGDADVALKRADFTVKGSFRSGFVEHAYIEPEAGYATFEDGKVEIHACTQAPVMDREAMEIILGWDPSKIRIIPTAVGGGFGSKLDISLQPLIALGAIKTGKPVRMTYSRTESMQSTTKRHPSEISLEIGATSDGRICGFDFYGTFNTGAYASWGPTVANRVPVHASGPYSISDYRAESKGIHTHCPPSGAFRGFGVPQSAIAQETLFDELAEKLGIDALEFRILNAIQDNESTVCGQVFTQGVGIKACLEALQTAWHRERANVEAFNNASVEAGSPTRLGVGVAAGWYGCGNTSLPNPSTIKAGIRIDGTVVLHQGAMDVGQGADTVIAQIFAQALGVPVSQLELVGADTDITPDAGKTSASRQTFVTGNAAKLSGQSMRRQILKRYNASEHATLTISAGEIEISDQNQNHTIDLRNMPVDSEGYVILSSETYDPPTKPLDENGQGEPYAQFGYAAHLVVVEVDTKLGSVKALRFTAAHDVGRAINPLLVEGQVQGGIAQGLGMALMEEYLPGRTENLHDYLIPTSGDIPSIDTIIIENPDIHGPYGAKGLGEHVLIPTAPAILNAIYDACSVRIRQVPATPNVLMSALKGK